MKTLTPPSKSSVDVILEVAPDFNALRSESQSKKVITALAEFVSIIYATDFVISFDWMKEFKDSKDLDPKNLKPLENADLPMLRKLLIAHLRLDRFCQGHLQALVSTGYMEKMLARLKTLRPTA